jgi:endonuclease/exonuclease/phosphatase family metal-dependent hydrolase
VVTLTVMTFNVGNGLARPKRLVRALQDSRADIVALQELSSAQADAVENELTDLFPHQVLVPAGFAGKGLLSRFPLTHSQQLALYPERPDLTVRLDVEGAALSLVVGHPPPPRFRGARMAFDRDALAQLETLASHAMDAAPGVLLGDMNMTPRHHVYAQFVAAGLVDAFAQAGQGRGLTLPVRLGHARIKHGLHRLPLRTVARVDYIWLTPGLRAESAWVGNDGGSDHLPVFARIAFDR